MRYPEAGDTIHIVYVHGWRGDHTSFQSFPTDLHAHLEQLLPNLKTHIYPTYKTEKPIVLAAQGFVTWLSTIPPGRTIISGHSMGGILAAEAALINAQSKDLQHPVIGILAFDVPYLGIHPHVVISGIASLFQGNDNKKSESEMNDMEKVNIVPNITPLPSPQTDMAPPRPPSPPSRPLWVNTKHFFKKHADDPLGAMKRWIVEHFEFGSCLLDPTGLRDRYQRLQMWDGEWVNLYTVTVPKTEEPGDRVQAIHSTDVLNLQATGESTSTDPTSNKAEGHLTVPTADLRRTTSAPDLAGMNTTLPTREDGEFEKFVGKSVGKVKEKGGWLFGTSKERAKSPQPSSCESTSYHFVLTPWVIDRRWQGVRVAGVDDEVAAHTGIFFRDKNLEYDQFVRDVGQIVLRWTEARR
jgi:pimeloyl-ACP methyl ester carboxylesterase